MGTERQVMQDYLDVLVKRPTTRLLHRRRDGHLRGTDQRADGREAAGQLIRYLHEGAFDARPEVKTLITDDGRATIEAGFAGTHTGEFAAIPATGRTVRVPNPVVYDLRGPDQRAAHLLPHEPAHGAAQELGQPGSPCDTRVFTDFATPGRKWQ